MALTDLTIHELQTLLKNREVSSRELTEAFLTRIQLTDAQIGAYITLCEEPALNSADAADARLAAGNAAALTGIPLALKDIFVTAGTRTTCASRILDNFIPPYDGTAVRRLREQGAVLLGKLNMDEFAMGSSNENSAFGTVRNPWNQACVPGGSSGGSAAAVAARQAVATLGTDTGGSIRQPASHCGVVGLKPTYGRVSRYGVIAYASSLDQVGPLTRDVEDCAIMLGAVAGYDPADSTSVNLPVPDYQAALRQGIKGLRIGLPREYFIEGLDKDIRQCVDKAIATLRELGAEPVEVSLPHTEYAVACYYLIATAEASSNLARYDGVRYGRRVDEGRGLIDMYMQSRAAGFGPEVKRRIMLGTYALSSGYYDAYYLKAQKVRTLIRQDFLDAFHQVDVILTPVAPTPAFRIGEKTADPLQMYLSDIFTIPVNLAGTCGISVPCGFSRNGLPIGMQLVGRPFDEATILKTAHAYEQATDWHRHKAPL
ncbi:MULTISPECIES: Asp-tRNA(Asn)/Glu-tRNA(Gln) amidotransferase subunit GatA [Syntrophotalea]|jgi:aspartyl-tRNA(Asn)/glutamyl-tRNA(Gln) amidotransferase subunit A|uniref:Glutamyl-tRNA(Gln) amidotransferase subunit A n=1 Tax=Syntrophotalea acetylenica TaxID=29542 RepID=A0A1L3GHF5_SYNAC|nr:Asp-tRNA(Asn)/Glu-tRNA(Gln) amidotransferase subunit GatA [Syntrophotalea acetylenica]APG25374.1 aspartyl/glutamyl-tRNA amidotransferase subunit A [Syntrophotalea acetylenica]APG43441.1 aspartyl/glutamyl-tRNA amidotransferase subunit A [Syntrophotalea acetylenica]MDY0262608.1 Asp-tRNA(Asn)/Glu-tRNA(Gln) amidotransferase subunit GatA [Syntrophotalea acetylenica]